MPFDAEAWRWLAQDAEEECVRVAARLDELAGVVDLLGTRPIGWTSTKQVTALLRQRGHQVPDSSDESLAALGADDALIPLLRHHRDLYKRASTYGQEYLEHVNLATGRIHPSFRQLGAASGRMSCSAPNLQQVPRKAAYRACFRSPEGRSLIKADLSQIELRVIAEVAGDGRMIGAFARGEDLYRVTAGRLLGKAVAEVTKSERQLSKALTLGFCFGLGPLTLVQNAAAAGVQVSEVEARQLRTRFFQNFPGISAWHSRQQHSEVTETRTLTGRRRLDVTAFTKRVNTPVQGSAADILKLALGFLWDSRDQCPSALLVNAVHDELDLEADADSASSARHWLIGCMERAMGEVLKKVPVTGAVEALIGRDWSMQEPPSVEVNNAAA
ncbi:MAG: hypothetical protein HY329_17190 [Chloroflexi bacterium]|nr:hypothetical protein [Chloroflexota bacterium]